MKTLQISIVMIGFLALSTLSFDVSSAQAQNSTNSKCMNTTEIDKSIVPPHGEGFPLLKNYKLQCANKTGSAIQMNYVPNITPVVNEQTKSNSQSMLEMIPNSGNAITAVVDTGKSTHIPVKIRVENGYSIFSASLSMVNIPPHVQTWTDPRDAMFFMNELVNGSLANATINIYVDSGAKAGTYDIGIEADGSMTDPTGKNIE